MTLRSSPKIAVISEQVDGPHGPIPIRSYSPTGGAVSSVPVVWIHGGAFVSGHLDQPESHDFALALAAQGFTVVTVAYRLTARFAPLRGASAVRYPVPLDDVVAVVRRVQRDAADGVILGGASAGACLAAGAILRLAADGDEPLRGAVFAYGTFHAALPELSVEVKSRLRGRRRFTHTPRLLGLMNLNYAGTRTVLLDPFAFAGGHPLDEFPPALMLDADRDSMRASGGEFAHELASAGIPVDYTVMTDTAHAFFNRPRDPGFARGIRMIADWAARTSR